jgi:hypothetical protein
MNFVQGWRHVSIVLLEVFAEGGPTGLIPVLFGRVIVMLLVVVSLRS